MKLGVFLPTSAKTNRFPVLYWLSGLTCTHENFITKAGAQRIAQELGVIVICPDTSPRGEHIPDDDGYDFGKGAGFYVDATQSPWSEYYHMHTYVTKELIDVVENHFPCDGKRSIFGHSMGGHGALTIALKNPKLYQSVSAFSPICSPIQCPWGKKALSGYLGGDESQWADYDACELLKSRGWSGPSILVDQGMADDFLESQLKPQLLEQAANQANSSITLRRQPDYDHSYYFIASFIEEHLRYHAEYLHA